MRLLQHPIRFANRLADRLAALAGAVAASQVPAFMQHYAQRLGGHLAEAQRNAAAWDAVAARTADGGLSAFLAACSASTQTALIEAGRKCAADLARVDTLQQAADALASASPWIRPFVFLRHLDPEIAGATFRGFTPNLPMDLESLVYGLVGLVLAMGLYGGIRRLATASARRLRARRAPRHPGAGIPEDVTPVVKPNPPGR